MRHLFFTLLVLSLFYSTPAKEQAPEKEWAFLGCIVLTLGIVKLKSSSIKISKPFKKEWMVQELPNILSNFP